MAPKSRTPARKSRTVEDSSDEEPAQHNYDDESEINEEEEEELEEDLDEELQDEDENEEEENEEGEDSEQNEEEEEEAEEEEELEEEEEEEEEMNDSEEEGYNEEKTPAKHMTARQRGRLNGSSANINLIDIAELEGSRSRKRVLSAEEQRIKRAELARRRRNQSQRRLEAEKKETLDKLLKKRAKKVRGNEESNQGKVTKTRLVPPHPALTSWVSNKNGFYLSVTSERANEISK